MNHLLVYYCYQLMSLSLKLTLPSGALLYDQCTFMQRLSEMCCFAVSQLLNLGKSIISHSNKIQDEDVELVKIEWPEESIEKAKIIRMKAQSMTGYVEAVSNSFITGLVI